MSGFTKRNGLPGVDFETKRGLCELRNEMGEESRKVFGLGRSLAATVAVKDGVRGE